MAKIKNRNVQNHHTKPKNVNKSNFERVYWPYIPLVFAISLVLVIGNTGGGLKAAVHNPLGKVLSYSTSMSIGGLLSDTNAQRAANGVANLSLNGKLDAAAQAKADDMATRNYWSHNTPEGNPPWVFVTAQGYAYQKLGENLAAGFSNEQTTVDGWMASPPHKANLLDPAFSEVGFGFANNPNYTSAGGGPMTIVVAFYGKPIATAPPPAAATAPPAPPPAKATVQSQSTSAAAPTPQPETPPAPVPSATAPPAPESEDTAQPPAANTETPKESQPVPAKTSRLQLAAPNLSLGAQATKATLFVALALGAYWASRHLRAIRKFLLQGEAYAVGHPITDVSLVIIAAALFILSQTVGLIQ